MSEAKQMRLSKVAKEFNLSLGKITEFLASKGRPVENNPNAKIGDEEYSLLSKEFSGDKSAKEEAQHIGSSSLKMKRESIVLEDPKVIRAREEEQKQKAIAEAAALKAAEEKAYICKKLGIHINDFNIIMNLPAKIYRDYPNDEKKLDFIYSIYKLLNRSL